MLQTETGKNTDCGCAGAIPSDSVDGLRKYAPYTPLVDLYYKLKWMVFLLAPRHFINLGTTIAQSIVLRPQPASLTVGQPRLVTELP